MSRTPRRTAMRHALGLIALLPVLQACASSHQEGLAARPAEPPRENLETRLQTLADKYAIEERSPRDPAVIRAQISRLEARRLTLLGQYTPTHPGVLQIERQLRLLREQLAEAESAPKVTTPPAP